MQIPPHLHYHPRIVVNGVTGSGKSMPAARLAALTAVPYVAVDDSRLLRPATARLVTREPICGENSESWRQTFSRDSIIAWHFRSFARTRETIAAWAAGAGGPPVVRLTSRAQVDGRLSTLHGAHS